MKALATLARLLKSREKSLEGQYRPGPYILNGGWLPASWGQNLNFWQMNLDPLPFGATAMVEACVSAYAQTVAMCPCIHWRDLPQGGRERVRTSSLSRVLRNPNDYQTASDFFLNLTRSLYLDGNGYALALRNDRFEITSLHLFHPRMSCAEVYGGEIFYSLGGNEIIEGRLAAANLPTELRAVPARDVLHVRLHTPRSPLKGESPLLAAMLAVTTTNTAMAQTIQFFANRARPSGVLETDLVLTKTQVDELRERWNAQAQGTNAGGTPILTAGLKWSSVAMSAQDAQLAEAMKVSDQQIAEVFRIPMALLGGAPQQPTGSTEALMAFWIANGLGFALNQVELAIDRVFGLPFGEYTELDTSILLRSAFKERIEGLARAVQGGVYSPNEARAVEGLPPAEDGDEPRVQQQVVPLSFADKLLEAQTAPPPAPAAPADGGNDPSGDPAADGEPGDPPVDETPPPDEGKLAPALTRDEWRAYLAGKPAQLVA